MIEPSTDHYARGVDRFIEQFRGKAFMAALLKSYLQQVQDLEDATWEVIYERLFGQAVGIHLDTIGKIVGRPRYANEEADADYFRGIRGQIRINLSNGTARDLIAIMGLMLPNFQADAPTLPYTFTYRDTPPQQVIFEVLQRLAINPTSIIHGLQSAATGGSRVLLWYTTVDPATGFELGSSITPTASATQGLGDSITPGTGGKLYTVTEAT